MTRLGASCAIPARIVLLALAALGTLAPGGPLAPLAAHAATLTIVNGDAAGEGFNDPTSAAPVGGNPGTTVGAQRLFVFQRAAAIWGSLLKSN
ncbi:MAG TPA: hypothetical protein VER38_03355, partial [Candidatus Eisenbacteria bacterium]|nr:hypothetical protein [Candidatus Eisenbacteria bacterium]